MNKLLSFILILSSFSVLGQDTTIVFNNFKYKFGAKFLVDKSNDYSLVSEGSTVTSGGVQIVRKFGKSRSSLESGVYIMSKAVGSGSSSIVYRNFSIPLIYRYDTKIFYIAGGIYADYLVEKKNNPKSYFYSSYRDRKLNLGLNLTLGIEKSISKQLSLLIEAHTINNLTSSKTDVDDLFSPSYSNNGFSIGINYKLLR